MKKNFKALRKLLLENNKPIENRPFANEFPKNEEEQKEENKNSFEEYVEKIDKDYIPENVGIYQWKNRKNGKIYIGQSRNLPERKKEFLKFSKRYAGEKINNDRRIYRNEEDWEYSILEHCKPSELNNKEIYYIETLDSFKDDIGYNFPVEEGLRIKERMILQRHLKRCDQDSQIASIEKTLNIFTEKRKKLRDEKASVKVEELENFLETFKDAMNKMKENGLDHSKWTFLKNLLCSKVYSIDNITETEVIKLND